MGAPSRGFKSHLPDQRDGPANRRVEVRVLDGARRRNLVADTRSGLLAGESVADSTFRGLLHEHALRIDAEHKRMRLDDGPEFTYQRDERDLSVTAADGTTAFVNVVRLDPSFSGDVPIGVAGRVRRIYRQQVLVQ